MIGAPERIAPMSADAVQKVRDLEAFTAQLPQIDIPTEHVLHGGMYARTITIPAGTVLTGALIELATLLIVEGDVEVFVGDGTRRLFGYHVIAAEAGRKQAFVTHADTHVTMVFPTSAQHVADAEEEFTAESSRLLSRRQLGHEQPNERTPPCQEQ